MLYLLFIGSPLILLLLWITHILGYLGILK